MKCYHTGLPQNMCGHCNGTQPLQVEPFGGMRPNDEPRRLHGEWVGRGQSTGGRDVNPMRLQAALVGSSPYVRAPFSVWGIQNMMRSVTDICASLSPTAIIQLAALGELKNLPVEAPQHPVIPGSKWIPVEADSEVTRKAPTHKWLVGPKAPTIKHARDMGRAAARRSATDRVR